VAPLRLKLAFTGGQVGNLIAEEQDELRLWGQATDEVVDASEGCFVRLAWNARAVAAVKDKCA
jgi:hypothetical protein